MGFEHVPVAELHVPATWHASCAVHVTELVGVQVPLWQVAASVQRLPSLQLAPWLPVGFEHVPVAELHVPATWHASCAVHVTELVGVQVPLWQVAASVQRLLSVQDVPVSATFEHVPVAGLHAAPWHWSDGVHVTELVGVQAPL